MLGQSLALDPSLMLSQSDQSEDDQMRAQIDRLLDDRTDGRREKYPAEAESSASAAAAADRKTRAPRRRPQRRERLLQHLTQQKQLESKEIWLRMHLRNIMAVSPTSGSSRRHFIFQVESTTESKWLTASAVKNFHEGVVLNELFRGHLEEMFHVNVMGFGECSGTLIPFTSFKKARESRLWASFDRAAGVRTFGEKNASAVCGLQDVHMCIKAQDAYHMQDQISRAQRTREKFAVSILRKPCYFVALVCTIGVVQKLSEMASTALGAFPSGPWCRLLILCVLSPKEAENPHVVGAAHSAAAAINAVDTNSAFAFVLSFDSLADTVAALSTCFKVSGDECDDEASKIIGFEKPDVHGIITVSGIPCSDWLSSESPIPNYRRL